MNRHLDLMPRHMVAAIVAILIGALTLVSAAGHALTAGLEILAEVIR